MATEEKILKYAETEPFNKPIREPILKFGFDEFAT